MADIQGHAPPNFDSVWAMFQEIAERFRETDKKVQETEREVHETTKAVREFSREMKESGRRMDQSKRELDRRIGDLGNRFGELAEHLAAPSINEKFNALGFHFDAEWTGRMCIGKTEGQTLAEIDLLLENTKTMIAVEIKAKPLERHVDEHLERLEALRAWADRHGDRRKIQGALAGAILSPGVRQYTLKAGLYVIVQTRDTVVIDIPEGFVPRQW
jgi:chromosome segregation ATPase